MKSIKVTSLLRNGMPTFDHPLQELLDECVPGGVLQFLTPREYISYQQIKWWKGVLLPALSKDQGETVGWWETRLKMAVMPDEFTPKSVQVRKDLYYVIPSITKLSIKKMGQLMEGSVSYCHDIGLIWVTLPAAELRST